MAAGDYSWLDLMRAMKSAGFKVGGGLINGFATAAGENTSRNLTAVYVNSDQWNSRDRGPWQINDHWHSEVSDACAFDLACSTKEAYRISGQGTSFSAWSAYSNGRYKQFVDLAYATNALDEALKTIDQLNAQLATLNYQVTSLEAEVAKDDADIATLRQQVTALSGSVATLQAKINKAQTDLA